MDTTSTGTSIVISKATFEHSKEYNRRTPHSGYLIDPIDVVLLCLTLLRAPCSCLSNIGQRRDYESQGKEKGSTGALDESASQ